METKEGVKAIRVRLICKTEKCGNEMLFTGTALMCNPPLYPHKCPKCGRTENVHVIYPYIEWEPR